MPPAAITGIETRGATSCREHGGCGDAEDETEDGRPCLEQRLDLCLEADVAARRHGRRRHAQLAEPGLEVRPGALERRRVDLRDFRIVVRHPEIERERRGRGRAQLGRYGADALRCEHVRAVRAETAAVGYAGRQRHARQAAAEGSLHDRQLDAEQVGGGSSQGHDWFRQARHAC
jgi:hypothetical protein